MGMEIDSNYNSNNSAQELAEIYRLQREGKNNVDKTNSQTQQVNDNQDKKKKETHLDTYNKSSAVSDSIEQQIKEQKEKIAEISKNLEGLRDDYYNTLDEQNKARTNRATKERELYRKEVSERSLKRIFQNWRKKFLSNQDDKEISGQYQEHMNNYDTASDEEKAANKAYDLAKTDAYTAISNHNSADTAFLGGLWSKEDAYWDLLKLDQQYAYAKMRESYNNK